MVFSYLMVYRGLMYGAHIPYTSECDACNQYIYSG